jgi:hypothetical protein
MNDIKGWFAGKRTGESRQPRILLFESEATRIARYALSSPGVEIGGDLFGFYTPDGSPLIYVASGAGPNSRRGPTHFEQDPEFQVSVFNQLASTLRMFYIGDWHSHHTLGLSSPSGSDDRKLQDLAAKNSWPQLFSLIIQTDSHSSDAGHKSGSRRGGASAREPDGSATPTQGKDVQWNAFHYVFDTRDAHGARTSIEFQSGDSPHLAVSETINRHCLGAGPAGSGSPGRHPARFPTGGVYQDSAHGNRAVDVCRGVCGVISDVLPRAEMVLDLEQTGRICLTVTNQGKTLVCGIFGDDDSSSFEVTINDVAVAPLTLRVQYVRGKIDVADVRAVAGHIVDALKNVQGGHAHL